MQARRGALRSGRWDLRSRKRLATELSLAVMTLGSGSLVDGLPWEGRISASEKEPPLDAD